MKIMHDQRGFSPWIILLILLILAALGFAGWRVWSADDDTATPSTTESASEKEPEGDEMSAEPEPIYAMPPSEAYRVELPVSWVKKICPDSENLLFLAPTTDKLGTCNSENGGTVAITKNSGDVGHPESYYMSDPHYGSVSYSAFAADSITGHKAAYTIATEDVLGYPPVGTQQTQYVLFDGANSFVIAYTRFSGDPDLAATVQALAESFDKL